MKVNRRHVLIGAGALALSNCRGKVGADKGSFQLLDPTDQVRALAAGGTGLNSGDQPWRRFDQEVDDETPRPMANFNPNYIAVLHLHVTETPFKLIGRRAHFPIDMGKPNTLPGITERAVEVIKHFNGAITQPVYLDSGMIREGLYQLGFSKPHHFIIYIKNRGVLYGRYPIWFGRKLLNPRQGGGYEADPNRSFFEAQLSSGHQIGADVSDTFVYVKNYFYTADETNDELVPHYRRPIGNQDKLKYALNINAMIDSSDSPAIRIPLVIDPDTGNMGGGGDGALP